MTQKEFDEHVYKTIGKIGTAKHLQEIILETLKLKVLINGVEHSVKPEHFYCYISPYVFQDWRLNNLRMEEYHVNFQCLKGDVFYVTIRNH